MQLAATLRKAFGADQLAATEHITNKTSTNKFWTPGLIGFFALWTVGYFALVPHPLALLSHNGGFIAVGFIGAVIGNMTALGGGLIFIPVLIFVCHVPPVAALKTSIASQVFGMTSGAIAWSKSGKIPWRIIPWALPGLLVGATISSLLIHPNAMLVKGVFGPVSISLGCMLLLSVRNRRQRAFTWSYKTKLAVILASLIGGTVTGWVAIGEGELVAAVLMLGFGLAADSAIALGVCLLSATSIYLAGIHLAFLGGFPWQIAVFTIPGCVVGARVAPLLARRINQKALKYTFAAVAILDGLLFITQFLLWSNH